MDTCETLGCGKKEGFFVLWEIKLLFQDNLVLKQLYLACVFETNRPYQNDRDIFAFVGKIRICHCIYRSYRGFTRGNRRFVFFLCNKFVPEGFEVMRVVYFRKGKFLYF